MSQLICLGSEMLNTKTGELTPVKSIEHELLLRNGLKFRIALPENLTKNEAERLAKFVETLPIPRPKKKKTVIRITIEEEE